VEATVPCESSKKRSISVSWQSPAPSADDQIFGPVIAASKFATEEEAIRLANSTVYGLGAGVFTPDHAQALRVTVAVDSGTVWCNHYIMTHNGVPFGGFKQSGVGRELGTYGLEEYQQIKAVHHNNDLKA
jgi:aldehyde dehydrogenase (NAD+)